MKKTFLTLALALMTIAAMAANLFDPSTTTIESWSMPGWQGEANTNVATYNNGTVVVNVPGDCSAQWQCQVKLHTQGIVLDASKTYEFSCKMNASRDVSLVTVKVFDDSPLTEVNSHALKSGDNTIANPVFQGGNIGNGIIVFDFGYAAQGTRITISNIVLQEKQSAPGSDPEEPGKDGYALVWNADFTGSSLPSNWNIEVNGDGGGNNELQYYCEKAVSLGADPLEGKHCLILTATKEDYQGKKCTSGRVNSKGHTYFQYGKVEARIWFPKTANGLWPAFWMMGNDFDRVGWPACGETDIIELGHSNGFSGNKQERYFNGASHWGPKWDQHYQHANSITYDYSVEDGFHLFTCIWTPEKVSMYVDLDKFPSAKPYYELSQPYSTETNSPGYYFNKPNFIIFNLAVGGNFPGIYDINKVTALSNGPQKMYVDWLRVYQRGDQGESFYAAAQSDAIETAPTALESIELEVQPTKLIQNGRLIIMRGEAAYDVMGHQL